jgi:Holliday junction resolvase RusA-like endonuclease
MTDSKKTYTFHQNPFYDDLFGVINAAVPSKRIGYKRNPNGTIGEAVVPQGAKEFEKYIRESFPKSQNPMWPRKGRLLIAMHISLIPSEYKSKDIDNIAKSILDALKGLAFDDDVQVDSVHLVKSSSKQPGFMIGIKELSADDPGWYFPPLCDERPFEEEQTYKIFAPKRGGKTQDCSETSN